MRPLSTDLNNRITKMCREGLLSDARVVICREADATGAEAYDYIAALVEKLKTAPAATEPAPKTNGDSTASDLQTVAQREAQQRAETERVEAEKLAREQAHQAAMKAAADEFEKTKAPKTAPTEFIIYTLYDANDPRHAGLRRIEYDGYYFVVGEIKTPSANIAETFVKTGHYPTGIVPRGSDIGDAYFPPPNTSEGLAHHARGKQLREWADYNDAVYAEWPDLQPCAGELKPVLQFNPTWLPDAIRAFVVDVSERMSVPIDFAAICSLTCLAGSVNHRAFVFPQAMDKDFAEPLCMSGAVIADSGKKKTPTWKVLMNPLYEWQAGQDEVYLQRMIVYDKEKDVYDRAKKEVDDFNKEERKIAKKEKRDPVLKPYVNLPPMPKEPEKPRRLVVNDSTPEQIHEIAKTNPQGLFYYRDELSGWAAELDMVGRESARTTFLDGMTGDHDHTVDRVGREGGYAKKTLSVFGSFQPYLFVEFLSETRNVANGMIPRFQLLVWPDSQKFPRLDRQVNEVAKAMYRQVIRRLADLLDKAVQIHMDKSAQELFYKFQDDIREKTSREQNPGKKSHLSKYEGGLARLAGLLQLVDVVAALPEIPLTSETVNLETGEKIVKTEGFKVNVPGEIHIDVDHLQRALDILGYLESHMHRAYDSRLEGTEYLMAKLIRHIKAGDLRDGMTAREIQRRDWGGLNQKFTTADAVLGALERLAELGWVRPIAVKPGAGAGRPTVRWEVNPVAREGGLNG